MREQVVKIPLLLLKPKKKTLDDKHANSYIIKKLNILVPLCNALKGIKIHLKFNYEPNAKIDIGHECLHSAHRLNLLVT